MNTALKVWGREYTNVAEMQARIALLEAENAEIAAMYGDAGSDERLSEMAALREAMWAVEAEAKRPTFRVVYDSRPAKRYTGATVKSATGTTHFVNGWRETFCGRYADEMPGIIWYHDERATCGTCCRAGDAALREGTMYSGGSAARRI